MNSTFCVCLERTKAIKAVDMSLPTETASSLLLQATNSHYYYHTPSSTPTSNSNSNDYNNNQAIGATPSAVLFFLALGVGVIIAFLFIFFTIRYFIRVKYGVNLSGLSRRNFYNYQGRSYSNNSSDNNNNNDSDNGNGTNNSVVNEHTFAHIFTTTEVQDQLQYIREHHYLRGEIIDRRLNYGSDSLSARRRRRRRQRRRRRRRRGGRFAKMKKLTIEEVELLFPQKTYSSWLNGGKQQDIEKRGGMLYEEEEEGSTLGQQNDINGNIQVSDERVNTNECGNDDDDDDDSSLPTLFTAGDNNNNHVTIGTSSSNNDIELKELTTVSHVDHDDETDLGDGISNSPTNTTTTNEKDHIIESHTDSKDNEEEEEADIIDQRSLHFDSGSCAICLELIEDDDIVRGLICGHVFHAECLDPWLTKRRACCPMCKRDYLFKRDYHDPNSPTTEENSGNSNNTDGATNTTTTTNNNNENSDNDNDNEDDDDDDDSLSLDLEELRNDPALQMMLQELIPPSERVRILLNDSRYSQLNLEERGHEISNKKYGRFFKIFFWKLMGISKSDLFNWAVLRLVHEYRRDNPELFQENTPDTNEGNNNNNDNQTGNGEQEETNGESNIGQESSTTPTTAAEQEETNTREVDIRESTTRRQIIENRV